MLLNMVEIEIFGHIINVFPVTIDQFIASLCNKSISFTKNLIIISVVITFEVGLTAVVVVV